MRFNGVLIALAVIVGFSLPARAQPRFSAAVSGHFTGGCYFLAFPVYIPSVEWVVFGTTYPTWADDIQAIDSPDGRTVFALLRTTGAGTPRIRIVKLVFDPRYPNNTRSPFFDGLSGYTAYGAFAVAKNGRVFAAARSSEGTRIAVISSAGVLENLLDVRIRSGDNIAVAPDNCTLFLTDRATLRRVNGCTGAPPGDFVTVDRWVTDVAVLSNGDVLATTDQALLRFNSGATLLRTFANRGANEYPPLLFQAVGVSADERTIVVAAMRGCDWGGQIIALSLPDGRELWRQNTASISTATSVIAGTDPISIPSMSDSLLLALVVVLAAAGLAAIRNI